MRYLIIDTQKAEEGYMSEVRLNQLIEDRDVDSSDTILLTEEESLAIFKQIWSDGNSSGFVDGFDGYKDAINSDSDWERLKKSL